MPVTRFRWARAHLRLGPLRLGGRPPSVRGPSAERPLELDVRIPSAHVDWQEEFVTCTVGDTTHSGRHNLLVYLYNLTWSHRLVCPGPRHRNPFLGAVVVMYVVRRGLVALVLAASLSACTAADEGWFHVKLVSDTGGQICDQRELHRVGPDCRNHVSAHPIPGGILLKARHCHTDGCRWRRNNRW